MFVEKNCTSLTSKEDVNKEIISFIKKGLYQEAKELVRNNKVMNSKVFDHRNFPLDALLFYMDSLENELNEDKINLLIEILKNEKFILNIETIRNFVRYLMIDMHYQEKILEVIKDRGIIENIGVKERTNLILNLSEYYFKKDLKGTVKKYISVLFTEKQLQESQQYFIHNFESYFNNFYSLKKSNHILKNDAQKIIKKVFIDKNHIISKEKVIHNKKISYGKDLKYIMMMYLSELFHKKELVYKKKGNSLFMRYFYFFVFFSKYIQAHNPIDGSEEFVKMFKEIQKKYNFSCVKLDNRFLYSFVVNGLPAKKLKHTIESALKNTSLFLKIKDFSSINLVFSSKVNEVYCASFESLFYHGNSTYIIYLENEAFLNIESVFLHEMTHFVHFHKNNKGCFNNDIFKRIIDKIYLHKERSKIIDELNKIVKEEIITIFFDKNMHCPLNLFKKRLNKILKLNIDLIDKKDNIMNIFNKYKKISYTDSTQYIFWKETSIKYNLSAKYFNQKHEIHARLNEMLNNDNLRWIDENSEAGLLTKNVFDLVREDLLIFNEILSKNINA